MFSRIRKRITYTNVLLTLALLFALTGGAYAAGKYVITSTKQISPKVLKALQGKTGAAGANGAPGAQGPAGSAGTGGSKGEKGETGALGPQGPRGNTGTTGSQGSQGEKGDTGTTGATGPVGPQGPLQSGKTETGAWGLIGPVVTPGNGTLTEEEQEKRGVSISFTLPVEPAVTPELLEGGNKSSGCPGTHAKPEAEPGFLCVYTTFAVGVSVTGTVFIAAGEPAFGATSSTGAIMRMTVTGETGTTAQALGTWAVTAK